MSSPISSALAKLDGSLQAVQSQIESLRAGLEVNDSQLSYGLADARQNAVIVRDLIRAERSDASWNDRGTLEHLIHELEIAAYERFNEQRRMKLLQLGDEFDAGAVRHRSEARTAALNNLRQEAIHELRAQAAIPEQEKELPGPDASQWLHWACNLQEEKDADALASLRTDFPALDHFAGEMEESYWMAGERIRRIPAQPSASRSVANPRRPPETPSYSSPAPSSPAASPGDYGRSSQNTAARPDTMPGGSYATAVARAYERPAVSSPVATEARRSEATLPQRGVLALVAESAEVQPVTHTCAECGAAYSDEYHVCPAADSGARASVAVAPTVVPRTPYPPVDKSKNGGNGASTQKEAQVNTSSAMAAPLPRPVERPVAEPSRQPDRNNKKSRKQRRAEAALAPIEAPETPRPKPVDAVEKIPAVAEAENEPWTQKWQALRENGGDALSDRGWRTFALAPEVLAIAALLLLVVAGSVWMVRRKHTASTPVVAVENQTPSSTTATPTAVAPVTSASATTPASSTSKNDTQSKPQDQNTAAKPNTDTAQTKDASTPPAQVLSVPVEVPKTTATTKKEEPTGTDAAPPSLPGAMSSNMGPLVKDMSANVPKLAGQKLRVSSGVAQGQLLRQVSPQYPNQARQERVEGTVVLQAVISKDGSVQKLAVVSGPSMLTRAAMDAVKQWRYRPFALNGEPVEADTQINVNFKLNE
jgi:TonB family protein